MYLTHVTSVCTELVEANAQQWTSLLATQVNQLGLVGLKIVHSHARLTGVGKIMLILAQRRACRI
jgi:hypothetical protein